jgi:hypothetical protein
MITPPLLRMQPTTARQPRLEAGAELTLEGIAWMPSFGAWDGRDPVPPTCSLGPLPLAL